MNLTFSKFKSFTIESGYRILKVFQFGAKTARESMPFGIDSVPLSDMIAIFGSTSENGDNVIVGYINVNHKIQTALSSVGGVYVPGNITTDISSAKIDEISVL